MFYNDLNLTDREYLYLLEMIKVEKQFVINGINRSKNIYGDVYKYTEVYRTWSKRFLILINLEYKLNHCIYKEGSDI